MPGQIETVPIDSLIPHPENYRHGDVDAIRESIRANQFYGVIVVQASTRHICAGNHRWEAAKLEGLTEIRAEIIDMDDATARRILAADNGTSDRATNDNRLLADLLADVREQSGTLEGSGHDDDRLRDLLAELEKERAGERADGAGEDDVPELPVVPVTQMSDEWTLGPHRLVCGDAFTIELPDCDALISDPPYGMGLDTTWYGSGTAPSNHDQLGKVDWDQAPFDASRFASASPRVALFGANYFCTSLPEAGTWWVWDKRLTKDGAVMDTPGMPYELIWLRGKRAHRMIRVLWSGFYRHAEDGDKERLHPTMKPVAVMREIIEYLTDPNSTVLDPFGGSGSTLIAAHSIGRVASLIEIDPAYCDVTARRWEQYTGETPLLNGEPRSLLQAAEA